MFGRTKSVEYGLAHKGREREPFVTFDSLEQAIAARRQLFKSAELVTRTTTKRVWRAISDG